MQDNPQTPDWHSLAREIDPDSRPLIKGLRTDPTGSGHYRSVNPATGAVVSDLTDASAHDIDAAVQAARHAFTHDWSRTTPRERTAILLRFADLLDEHAAELGLLDTIEMGMPITGSVSDVAVGSALVRWCAETAGKTFDDVLPHQGATLHVNRRVPRGVVGAIVPWNFPTFNALSKLAPALATGNTVVLKPSELASLSALLIGRLLLEAGVPPGAVSVVPGTGAVTGEALALHPDVDQLTFTGSTRVGRMLMECSARSNLKPLALELGGKSPQIVLADATDLDAVAQSVCDAAFWNSGQVCTSGSRLLVHEDLHDELVDRVTTVARGISIGDPLDPSTTHGPLASELQHARVAAIVADSLAGSLAGSMAGSMAGSVEVYAGATSSATLPDGFGYDPTVLGVSHQQTRLRDEIFGPVLTVQRFADVDEAVALANDTDYGLAAYVWTGQPRTGYALAGRLVCGSVRINPGAEGGEQLGASVEPARSSGFGPEGGLAGLQAYTRMQLVSLSL